MRVRLLSLLSLLLLLGTACGSEPEQIEAPPTAEAAPSEAAEAESEVEAPATEEPAEETANVGEAMAQGLAEVSAALEASANAEGDTPCEQTYNGVVAMFAALPDGPNTERSGELPDREEFMAGCGELPEETQRCMNPGYGMGHPECQAALQTPEALAFRDAMRGGSGQ